MNSANIVRETTLHQALLPTRKCPDLSAAPVPVPVYTTHIFRWPSNCFNVQLPAGKILVGWLPFIRKRILEDNTRKLPCDLFLCLPVSPSYPNIHFYLFPRPDTASASLAVFADVTGSAPKIVLFVNMSAFRFNFVQKFKGSQQ